MGYIIKETINLFLMHCQIIYKASLVNSLKNTKKRVSKYSNSCVLETEQCTWSHFLLLFSILFCILRVLTINLCLCLHEYYFLVQSILIGRWKDCNLINWFKNEASVLLQIYVCIKFSENQKQLNDRI